MDCLQGPTRDHKVERSCIVAIGVGEIVYPHPDVGCLAALGLCAWAAAEPIEVTKLRYNLKAVGVTVAHPVVVVVSRAVS